MVHLSLSQNPRLVTLDPSPRASYRSYTVEGACALQYVNYAFHLAMIVSSLLRRVPLLLSPALGSVTLGTAS